MAWSFSDREVKILAKNKKQKQKHFLLISEIKEATAVA